MANINLVGMDFDAIKSDLKTFLQAQNEFSDYDFEGAGLSVLLDILAYNTHYNAYLANMLVNEMFLDSAVKKSSALSLAKHIGYTPRSVQGSIANIDVTVSGVFGNPYNLTLEKFTPFNTTIDGTAYTFYNTEAKTVIRSNNTYTFSDIDVKEGELKQFSYAVYDTTPDSKYEIGHENVDLSTLEVTVQKSATNPDFDIYTFTDDLIGLDSTSKVFFVEKNTFDKFVIYFGDGVIGKNPEFGNIINLKYISSTGKNTNVSNLLTQSFSAGSSIGGSSTIAINTNSNSTGGKDIEDITSIKFYAPKFNSARNRVVTAQDYEALIAAKYTEAESVSVWGGEDNDPPVYGKVIVSLKPYEGFSISNKTKESIKDNILKSKQGLTIQVEFIDPTYFYVGVNCKVTYDQKLTTKTSGTITNDTISVINSYFNTDLQKFNKDFNHSKLIDNVLASNSSIVNVLVSLTIQRRFIPVLNSVNSFVSSTAMNFRNPITPGKLYSSYFYIFYNNQNILVQFLDKPNTSPADYLGMGKILLKNVTTGETIYSDIGTVNYATGKVEINDFTPVSYPTGISDIRITCGIQEGGYNLTTLKNEIFVMDDSETNLVIGTNSGLKLNVVNT